MVLISIAIYYILLWRKNRPILRHFKADDVWKAFVLNSISAALVIFVAISTKKEFDTSKIGGGPILSALFTLLSTFVTSMVSFALMYVVFGFGIGMVINEPEQQ